MRTQRFGIEIEMTGITRERAAKVIAEYFGTASSFVGGGYSAYQATDRQGRVWKAMSDGSITCQKKNARGSKVIAGHEYSTEIVSPILTYADIADLQEIVRQLRHAGAFVNRSCGIHIHVDASRHTPQTLKNLVNLMAQKEDILYRALQIAPERLRYCKKVNEDLIRVINARKPQTLQALADMWYAGTVDSRTAHYNESRYRGLNLHATFTKGTVEFRLFNSTTHAGEIKAYIQFCLALSHQALTQKKASCRRSVTDNERYCMRCWLLRLGLNGDEFKTCRHHMTKNLSGDSAWRHGRCA
ncbi:MAG: amidoligase family protein [Bacteroidales bacterium]|nr:amidoligase family protein [Bacteroidales bacterium]MCM1415870.1 amidoligase family protein [bacterium]